MGLPRVKKGALKTARSFVVELAVYALFVLAYFFAVLHFLGGWLKHLFDGERILYAAVSLGLMVTQAFVLEFVARRLVEFVRKKI